MEVEAPCIREDDDDEEPQNDTHVADQQGLECFGGRLGGVWSRGHLFAGRNLEVGKFFFRFGLGALIQLFVLIRAFAQSANSLAGKPVHRRHTGKKKETDNDGATLTLAGQQSRRHAEKPKPQDVAAREHMPVGGQKLPGRAYRCRLFTLRG